ncbi:MAG: TRAP transporter small permease subunit [Candidatus Azotimanducaceae bacterium]|jgi:TRAP-type mannitol/chloroaromatic compound transport system permease small subunit
MKLIHQTVDQLSSAIGVSVSWFALIMVIITAIVVVFRYFLNLGSIPLQETIVYLHGALIMLAIGFALKNNAHVRVDVIHRRLGTRQKHWIEILGFALFLLPVAVLFLVTSFSYVSFSWSVLESSSAPGGLPGVFALKTLIPVMALLLLMQGISQTLKAIEALRS